MRPRPLALALGLAACDPREREPVRTAELPNVPACDAVRDWSDADTTVAAELYDAIVAAREVGGRCGALARFPPSGAPTLDPTLTCAARLRAQALADPDAFGHADADDRPPWDLLDALGYTTIDASELIATGELAPAALVEGIWRASPPHCAALLPGRWRDVGLAHLASPPADGEDEPTASWVVLLADRAR